VSNVLDNGTVLPFGLLSGSSSSMHDAFKKTYQNTSMKMGSIVASYAIDDDNNISKTFPEYDVMTFEQNEDQGSTTITYKHCLAASSFGSIADFFEANLRKLEKKTSKGVTPSPSGQNGAIVLLLCLNGMSETGYIISSLAHPDRPTTLVDDQPHAEGEYNGVRIVVNSDGSTSLTFKGATDNDGNVIDSTQGNTVISIAKDGSFQVNHDAITFSMARDGTATLNAKKDINLITATNLNITATGNIVAQCAEADVTTSGAAKITVGADATLEVTGKATINASEVDVQGSTGKVLTNVTDPVVDTIFGEPTQGVPTFKAG
jgi:hypothetical protein